MILLLTTFGMLSRWSLFEFANYFLVKLTFVSDFWPPPFNTEILQCVHFTDFMWFFSQLFPLYYESPIPLKTNLKTWLDVSKSLKNIPSFLLKQKKRNIDCKLLLSIINVRRNLFILYVWWSNDMWTGNQMWKAYKGLFLSSYNFHVECIF